MIIECEECHKRYLVSDSAIGDEGRIVRCTHCSHMWHQNLEDTEAFDPEVDEDAEDASFEDEQSNDTEDLESVQDDANETVAEGEDIVAPDAVVDSDDNSVSEAVEDNDIAANGGQEAEGAMDVAEAEDESSGDQDKQSKGGMFSDDGSLHNIMEGIRHDDMSPQAKRNGYIGAAVIFALQMAILLALHGPIVEKMPFMMKAYSLVGIDPKLPGEKLILDGIKAELVSDAGGIETLNVSGVIMNRQPLTDKVPDVSVRVKNPEDGGYGYEQGVKLRNYISEGDVINFETSDVQDYPDDISEIEVSLKWHPYMVYESQNTMSKDDKKNASHDESHDDAHGAKNGHGEDADDKAHKSSDEPSDHH